MENRYYIEVRHGKTVEKRNGEIIQENIERFSVAFDDFQSSDKLFRWLQSSYGLYRIDKEKEDEQKRKQRTLFDEEKSKK